MGGISRWFALAQRSVARQFHDSAQSWSRVERIVARVEAGLEGTDTRFIVTSLEGGRAKHLYQRLYCARGQAENHIKAWKNHLAADRTSCHAAEANQFRLFLHAGEEARKTELHRGQISSPEVGDGALAQAAHSATRLVRISRILERLADELALGRPGPAYSLLHDGDGLVAQGRRIWGFDDQRLLLLDGTANPDILRQFVPQLQDVPEIRVQRNARIIQVQDLTFFRHSLVERAPAGECGSTWRPTARLAAVAEFIAKVAREGRTVVVTNKRVRCALTGENPSGMAVSAPYAGADIAHFGNIRGTNEFKDHDAVIILGREQPSVRAAERLAKAIWYDTPDPIRTIPVSPGDVQYPYRWRPYTLRDGSLRRVQVRVHPDPRVQAVVEQIREAEMIQGIDRLRLIHSARKKTVFTLCNIPLDIPVDRLVTWRQLAGDSRLADALAACEENGWEALPLAAQKLSELFPDLWGTARAAEGLAAQ